MGLGQILHVDVIPDRRAVFGWIVVPNNLDRRPAAEGGLAGDLDQMVGVGRGLARPALRIGPRHVEVAQDDVAHAIGRLGATQHLLEHELRPAVGIDGFGRGRLRHRHRLGDTVDRRRGREDERAHVGAPATIEQRQRMGVVVEVTTERIGDGLRHDDAAREMHHHPRPVSAEKLKAQVGIADRSQGERHPRRHQTTAAGGQVVEHDRRKTLVPQRIGHMGSDIPGAAGHHDRITAHDALHSSVTGRQCRAVAPSKFSRVTARRA